MAFDVSDMSFGYCVCSCVDMSLHVLLFQLSHSYLVPCLSRMLLCYSAFKFHIMLSLLCVVINHQKGGD